MYDLIVKMDSFILKMLQYLEADFLLYLYRKYVPERDSIFGAFGLFLNSFPRIYVAVTSWKKVYNCIITKAKKTACFNILCIYIINILEKTIGASSNYFTTAFQFIMFPYEISFLKRDFLISKNKFN